jgi:primosomal protein N''
MHDVVCEILLREAENLLSRYLRKMRKNFTHMRWDEDQDELSASEFMTEAVSGLSLG